MTRILRAKYERKQEFSERKFADVCGRARDFQREKHVFSAHPRKILAFDLYKMLSYASEKGRYVV